MTNCKFRFQSFSYRFAEQVLKSKLALKREIEEILSERIPASAHAFDAQGSGEGP